MSGGEDGGSFEARLKAARLRQGLDPRLPDPSDGAADHRRSTLERSALSIGLRVGVELVSALIAAVAIGWWLDHWLHTAPVLLGVFVLLGGAAGVANVWRIMGSGALGAGPTTELTGRPVGGSESKGRDSGG